MLGVGLKRERDVCADALMSAVGARRSFFAMPGVGSPTNPKPL